MPAPLYTDDFLQDVMLAFCARRKAMRYATKDMVQEREAASADNEWRESLAIEARYHDNGLTKLRLWQDGLMWVYHIDDSRKNITRRNALIDYLRYDTDKPLLAANALQLAILDFRSFWKSRQLCDPPEPE